MQSFPHPGAEIALGFGDIRNIIDKEMAPDGQDVMTYRLARIVFLFVTVFAVAVYLLTDAGNNEVAADSPSVFVILFFVLFLVLVVVNQSGTENGALDDPGVALDLDGSIFRSDRWDDEGSAAEVKTGDLDGVTRTGGVGDVISESADVDLGVVDADLGGVGFDFGGAFTFF